LSGEERTFTLQHGRRDLSVSPITEVITALLN